jgi:hypothetical protein
MICATVLMSANGTKRDVSRESLMRYEADIGESNTAFGDQDTLLADRERNTRSHPQTK